MSMLLYIFPINDITPRETAIVVLSNYLYHYIKHCDLNIPD